MKYIDYENAKKYVTNKDTNVNNYIDYMFCRTNEMFIYTGLPETIPQEKLEFFLQKNGSVFVTKVNGKLYAFNGSKGGLQDVYGDNETFLVNNIALKYNEELKIDVDGVLIKNDIRELGLLPILSKYGALLTDCEVTLNTLSIIMRAVFLISASDDNTKKNADDFLSKLIDGNYSVIGESAFFDGVKIQSGAGANTALINQFIELTQYIKGSAFHDVGLNANYNLKRERLTAGEVDLNNDALIPYAQNMLDCRKIAIEKINKMYGTSINVELAGVWKAENEQLEKATETVESETDSVTDTDEVLDTDKKDDDGDSKDDDDDSKGGK